MRSTSQESAGRRLGLDLVPEVQNVAKARAFVAGVIDLWDCDDPDRIVELLTSEVVTNAVRHARGPIRLEASLGDDGIVKVETSDHSLELPQVGGPDPLGESGRGLLLVQSLAAHWGVDRFSDHKVVWFEVPLMRRPERP
jgi:anti-sigma regulatory factor (Ser/Thr protein kinase)